MGLIKNNGIDQEKEFILDTDNVELQIKQWVLDDLIKLSKVN